MTVPENLMRKWRKIFLYRDTDNDGIITEEDYQGAAENFVKFYGERAAPTREIGNICWYVVSKKGQLSQLREEDYVGSFCYFYLNELDVFKEKIKKYCNLCFDAIDSNGDGVISKEEYTVYQNCFGVTNQDYIQHVFNKLDTNQDGVISRDEFVDEIMDYTFEDKPENIPELYDHQLAKTFKHL